MTEQASAAQARVIALRTAGKLTVRERLDLLLDADSFQEIGALAHSAHPDLRERTPADGVVCGSGRIHGRPVHVIADDPLVLAGTRGRIGARKVARILELAEQENTPVISLHEAGAARLQETHGAMSAGLGEGFEQYLRLSGRVPLVSVILGAAFGGPSFLSAMADAVFLVRGTGFMGMSGPKVVKVGIGQDTTPDAIGGAEVSSAQTGQAHHVGEDEPQTLAAVRRYLSYFPGHSQETPPRDEPRDPAPGAEALADWVPQNQRRAYSARQLLTWIVDDGSLFELSPAYGRSMVTALARVDGRPVGIIANDPQQQAGVLSDKTATKQRHFIDLCDAFHIPLVFFTDTPGFLVGPEIEQRRMVSLCARLMTALVSSTVPKITVVMRKAVGMAYLAMCGRSARPNRIVAWPHAFFDVMGPEAGVMLLHGREIAQATDPAARKQEILDELSVHASAAKAAGLGLIDDVIYPTRTRALLIDTLARAAHAYRPGFKHRVEA